MDSAVEIESERVGEKRLAEGDGPTAKRIKGRGLVGDVKKVAEMVLVLAAMGKIRGGKGPTEFEKDLMAEARERLAKVCEGVAPKDVFPKDAFGGMIEDLGLNKLKEQRLGFRPPKISIAEKLMLSKRKMVKSSDFSVPSVPHSSQLGQVNSGAAVEIRGTLRTVRMPQSDKESHMPISSGSFQSASSFGHVTPAGSVSLSYELPTSEIRPMLPSALPSSHSAALPRVDQSDGRPSGSSYPSQVKANYSANSAYGTPTWSVQPQFVSAAKSGTNNKVPVIVNMSVRVEGAAASRPVVNQNPTTLLSTHDLKGMNFQAPPMVNGHADICKTVQKLLHPSAPEHSTWNPPSTDYMNKALTCQVCMYTIAEIDNILVCDCCEKGFHIKCLQTTTTHKGVPRGEWHCGKCLTLTNGKPFPPKYGRVMRNSNPQKLSSNAAAVPSSSNKKVEASGKSVSQSKLMANGNSLMQNVPVVSISNNNGHPMSGPGGPKTENAREMLGNDIISSSTKIGEKISSRTCPTDLMKLSGAGVSPTNSSVGKSWDGELVDTKSNHPTKSENVPSSYIIHRQAPGNVLDGNEVKLPSDDASSQKSYFVKIRNLNESHAVETSNNKSKQLNEQEVIQDKLAETLTARTGIAEQDGSSSDVHAVNWVGGAIQISDEKTHYQSCCINGRIYEIKDYVLIRFDNDKLIPSKLQDMWEDNSTRMKWVTVNRCYFPCDLPKGVGRPCGLESSEVYESNRLSTIMAAFIQCPCEVLPPRKFAEEIERRTRLRMQSKDQLEPLYLCKWLYDESKGLFRDISC